MDLYVYKLTLKTQYHEFSAWTEAVQETLKRHASFLHDGVKAGRVLIVGRTDTQLKDNYGIAVFKAESAAEARSFMESDPVIQEGIMSAEVLPFKLLMVTDEAQKWNVWSE